MDYYQGYEDATRQTRVTRSTGLLGFLVRTLLSIIYSAFIYVPLLFISYIIVNAFSGMYSNDTYIKLGLTSLVCYLLFAGIYFLKGLVIGLRSKDHVSWVALFILCVLITSGIQAIGTQSFLSHFFAGRNVNNYHLWSWLGAAVVALLIYSHYQFLTNVSPRVVFWSYQVGFSLSRSNRRASDNFKAQKSQRYFDNTPMKVSFRK